LPVSAAFTLASEELEGRSPLDRMQARGTVRLALKEAGLDANSVTASQMAMVAEKYLLRELTGRRIEEAEALCACIRDAVVRLGAESAVEPGAE
jgi:hypothetical protein